MSLRVLGLSALLVACSSDDTIETVGINEIVAGSADADWLELMNVTDAPYDVSDYVLVTPDGEMTLPSGTLVPANGYLMVWFDGGEGPLSSDLALPDTGGRVELWDANDTLVGDVDFPASTVDEGFGRVPDAAPNWQVIAEPTPGESNG